MNWISVKERLPEIMQKIDVFIADKRWPRRLADCFMDKNKTFCKAGMKGEWDRLENVTHWMPLPEPPKENEL